MKAIRLYAQVLVDVASQAGGSSQVLSELSGFAKTLDEGKMLLKFFENPAFSYDEKNKAMMSLTEKEKLSPLAQKFLSMLVKRNRVSFLPSILKQVEVLQVEKAGGVTAELTSAVALESGTVQSVVQALSKKLNRPVTLTEKVDPSLIAGMRVTVGGVTFDGSVKNKLDQLSASIN